MNNFDGHIQSNSALSVLSALLFDSKKRFISSGIKPCFEGVPNDNSVEKLLHPAVWSARPLLGRLESSRRGSDDRFTQKAGKQQCRDCSEIVGRSEVN